MQPAAFLCVICAICGRINTQEYSINCTKKTQCLPQISQIYADETQNNINHKTQNNINLTNLSFSAG